MIILHRVSASREKHAGFHLGGRDCGPNVHAPSAVRTAPTVVMFMTFVVGLIGSGCHPEDTVHENL